MENTTKEIKATAPEEQKLTEQQQQKRVVKWCAEHEADLPELKLLYHVPNERRCTPQQGRQLKLMGVRAGVPDLQWKLPLIMQQRRQGVIYAFVVFCTY